MSNFLFINTSFLTNLNHKNDRNFQNLKNNFLFLIHRKFEELKNKSINEIKGGSDKLFYVGVEMEYQDKYNGRKKEIEKFMNRNFSSYHFTCDLVKIKHIANKGKQFSLLSVLYIQKSEYSAIADLTNSKKDYDENYLFFLFPIFFGDLHK